MKSCTHNLLAERLIGVVDARGQTTSASLPEVLALLAADKIESFAELRAHQAHAWHALLVQLAALALHRDGRDRLPSAAEEWAVLLRRLTPDFAADEPWCLVVEDWSKPAFLQPPSRPGTEKEYRGALAEPDQIDLLVTAKNHDVKAARIVFAKPAHWLFALVALQTMEGFLGAGNYGISRMNGGFSSRPALGLAPGPRPGAHFQRDVAVLLSRRADWFTRWPFFQQSDGLALLWLKPWDGTDQIDVDALDPWYIEICRRIRLRIHKGGVLAVKAGSKFTRVAGAMHKGNVGDPWVPIDRADGKALSLTASGFSYDRLQDLLFGGAWEPSPLQRLYPGIDQEQIVVIARGLARGQGQTAGYHERILPVPASARRWLSSDEKREQIGAIARRRVEQAAEVGRHVLWPVLLALHDDAAWVARWRGALDAAIDVEFFPLLWDEVGAADAGTDTEPVQRAWRLRLKMLVEQIFEEARAAVPHVSSRKYKTLAHAEGLFRGLLHKHFADLRVEPLEEIA
jgi:CRISPR system Cascade subunit CasA